MDPCSHPTGPVQPATPRRLARILDDWRRAEHDLAVAVSPAVRSAAAAEVRALRREYASAHEVVRRRYVASGPPRRERLGLDTAAVFESIDWLR